LLNKPNISARRRAAAKKVRQLKEGTDNSDENNDDNDDDLLADMNIRKYKIIWILVVMM
jgi:hypothetical protein